MARESLRIELQKQQDYLNLIRQTFHIDQNHPMLTRADEIQKQIHELTDNLCHPDAVSYGSINEALVRYINSQIDGLKQAMLFRK